MPVSATRDPVPPRYKKDIPGPTEESPAPPQEEQPGVPGAKIPLQESTPDLLTCAEGESAGVPSDMNSEPVPTKKVSPSAKYGSTESSMEGPTLISWKAIHPPPLPSPPNGDRERASAARSTMSVTDAKEIIGRSISLKERMATFQPGGGSGPTNPPPKPTTKNPTRKPPQKPVSSPSLTEEKLPISIETVVHSPLFEIGSAETSAKEPTESAEQKDGRGVFSKDPETEGHQQDAAITSYTGRSVGAKTGKAPPAIAPKPLIRRPGVPKEEETKPGTYHIKWLDGEL